MEVDEPIWAVSVRYPLLAVASRGHVWLYNLRSSSLMFKRGIPVKEVKFSSNDVSGVAVILESYGSLRGLYRVCIITAMSL
jgi:hypothetical protein